MLVEVRDIFAEPQMRHTNDKQARPRARMIDHAVDTALLDFVLAAAERSLSDHLPR